MYVDQTIQNGASRAAKRSVKMQAWVALDQLSGTSLYRHLYEGMRVEIVSGRLPARLPLAQELQVSRRLQVSGYRLRGM